MDKHKLLKDLLETLFDSLDMSSWNIYETKTNTTVCSIRFIAKAEGGDTSDKIKNSQIAFKRKSPSQLQRDRRRVERYNTRSKAQTGIEGMETLRDQDSDTTSCISHCSVSDADLTPVAATKAGSSQVNALSPPALRTDSSTPACDTSSAALDDVDVSLPSLSLSMTPSAPPSVQDVRGAECLTPSNGEGHSHENSVASKCKLPDISRPSPDPPPQTSQNREQSDTNKDDKKISDEKLIASIMNKPDEEVTIKDALRLLQTFPR